MATLTRYKRVGRMLGESERSKARARRRPSAWPTVVFLLAALLLFGARLFEGNEWFGWGALLCFIIACASASGAVDGGDEYVG